MYHLTYKDMLKRAGAKHVIAEELNIVVANTGALSQAKDHELEQLKRQLRILETKLY